MNVRAGVRAVSVAFPEKIRENDHYREHHRAVVDAAESRALARIWKKSDTPSHFGTAMEPYLADPFRGTVRRRVLGPGETALTLQRRASAAVLEAAGLGIGDVDLLISCAFFPDQIDVGNAALLARDLGLRGTAWNLESACSSAVVALDTAAALVETGRHRSVLIAVACTYSSVADEADTMSWFLGDGGGALLVSRQEPGFGILGTHAIHTAETCGAFYQEMIPDPAGGRRRMLSGRDAGKALLDTAEPYLLACCEGAIRKAGVAKSDIRMFLFNTPTAWYADFGASALGVGRDRTVSYYADYANIGPALPLVNLHHAARDGRLVPGDLVLLYSVGSASSATATVMRWGDVALGTG